MVDPDPSKARMASRTAGVGGSREPVNIIDNMASHICIGQCRFGVFVFLSSLFFAFCIIVLS